MSNRKRSRGGARATASSESSRSLRQKASKSIYIDGLDSDSDEESRQNFSLEDKLASTKFPQYSRFFVKEMQGPDVNLAHFQRTGFQTPIWIKSKVGLEMTVPESDFSVTGRFLLRMHIGSLCGSNRGKSGFFRHFFKHLSYTIIFC